MYQNNYFQPPPPSEPYPYQEHESIPYFDLLRNCKLRVDLPFQPVTLPSKYKEIKPTEFKYDFALELQTLSEAEEERNREKKEQEAIERHEQEMKLKAQEEAWKALEEKKRQNIDEKRPKDPEVLVDLDFAQSKQLLSQSPNPKVPSESPKPQGGDFPSKAAEALFEKLREMGMDSANILIALEVLGWEDESKVIHFVADFQKLEEQPEHFTKGMIKHSLLTFEDFDKSLDFLRQTHKLNRSGFSSEQILEALSLFDNDVSAASKFLEGYSRLKELGFSDLKIREALMMCNNDSEKAVQYLIEA